MTWHQIAGHGSDFGPRLVSSSENPAGGMFPLHRLPNIFCSTGDCREVDYWAMGYPQEGWLQLDQIDNAAVPVDLFAFSSRGVGIILKSDVGLQQGAYSLLMTPAHGAGISHRPVRCCWHRPDPQDPDRQYAGLCFEANDHRSRIDRVPRRV
jgi:hypothetical protein